MRGRRACLLSNSIIADDPRVRRQGDALTEAGWEVTAIGLGNSRSPPPSWRIIAIDEVSRDDTTTSGGIVADASVTPSSRASGRFAPGATPFAKSMALLRLLSLNFFPMLANRLFWSGGLAAIRQVANAHAIYDAAEAIDCDLWIANDWPMLPVATRLAGASGGRVMYDTHELATHEGRERLSWRLAALPLVAGIERDHVAEVAVVTTVSESIARELDELYDLGRPALAIRNVPGYVACEFRPTGDPVRVLYHGVISGGRGLENAILSVANWPDGFELTLRGPGQPALLDELHNLARSSGVEAKVHFEPAVPAAQLIAQANAFDVGIVAMPGHSKNHLYALPNKLFEYTMAGLAVMVTDLPEMTAVIEEHRNGVRIGEGSADEIAEQVKRLDRATIDQHKKKSLVAAKALCWESERTRFLECCEALVA